MGNFRKAMAVPMGLTALALAWLFWRQGGADTPLGAVLAIAVLLTMCGTFYNFGRWQRSNRRGWPTVACATLLGPVLALYAIAPTSPESRSEEHTSELQSLMRISYAVFCLKKKHKKKKQKTNTRI